MTTIPIDNIIKDWIGLYTVQILRILILLLVMLIDPDCNLLVFLIISPQKESKY